MAAVLLLWSGVYLNEQNIITGLGVAGLLLAGTAFVAALSRGVATGTRWGWVLFALVPASLMYAQQLRCCL